MFIYSIMTKPLDDRVAIKVLYKAGKYTSNISKDLKINKMFLWRILKKYKERGKVENRLAEIALKAPYLVASSIWSILESKASAKHFQNLDALKA